MLILSKTAHRLIQNSVWPNTWVLQDSVKLRHKIKHHTPHIYLMNCKTKHLLTPLLVFVKEKDIIDTLKEDWHILKNLSIYISIYNYMLSNMLEECGIETQQRRGFAVECWESLYWMYIWSQHCSTQLLKIYSKYLLRKLKVI